MKAALIALALLVTPAAADTIYISLDPYVLSQEPQYQSEYVQLLWAGFYNGDAGIPLYGITGCPTNCVIPSPSRIYYAFYGFYNMFPGDNVIFGTAPAVPEPSTWALLLFGFAFFGIKGIWPAWKRK